MTPHEVKSILLAQKGPAEDPETREALDVLAKSPELQAWHDRVQVFHSSVERELKKIEPPPGLKERILAERKIARPVFNRRGWVLAAAAASVLMAVGISFWRKAPREARDFENFRSRMVGFAIRQYSMDVESTSQEEVRQHLARAGAPSTFPIPDSLLAAGLKGGGKLAWHGAPVAMVCFNGGAGKTLYLFALEQGKIEGGPAPSGLVVEPFRGVSTARWAEGGAVYLLVGEMDAEALRRLLTENGSLVVNVAFGDAGAFEQPVIIRSVRV